MGNTCSSVHIALTGTTDKAIDGIVGAYGMLGYRGIERPCGGGVEDSQDRGCVHQLKV